MKGKARLLAYVQAEAPWHMRGTVASRVQAQTLGLPNAQSTLQEMRRCQAESLAGGTNAFQKGDGVYYCPGRVLQYNANEPHQHLFVFAHEMAHSFDSLDLRASYSYLRNCLNSNYSEAVPESIRNKPHEWIADSLAASFTAHEFTNSETGESDALRALHREFSGFCHAGHDEGGHEHPPARVRINTLLGGNEDIQRFFRCERFENTVPLNQCHHFSDGTNVSAPERAVREATQ